MTDYFTLLGQRRLPWLDPDDLKSAFLKRSSEAHPDRFHQSDAAERAAAEARCAELNAAHQQLRDPRNRLLHLLELELGRKPAELQTVPADTMEMFSQIGALCREVDAFRAEQAKATSPMLKVRFFERALDWVSRLQAMQQTVASCRTTLEARLKAMNAAWESAPPPGEPGRPSHLPLAGLEEIYRQLSFLARWSGQIQDRIGALTL